MDLGEVGWGGLDWIGLESDRDKLRALVNSAMNFGFHKILEHYRVATQLVASRVSAQLHRLI
jgi:hypothetical protein